MAEDAFPKVGHSRTSPRSPRGCASSALDLPCDDRVLGAAEGSPLAQPLDVGGFVVGNRWCIHPMEGWDGTTDGEPTEHTLRRWKHFGESGAKLIWGGEAFAVQARRPRESESDRRRRRRRRPRRARLARRCSTTLIDAHRDSFGNDRRPARRPPAHALRPILSTVRQEEARAAHRVPPPDPRREVRHRPGRRLASSSPTTTSSASSTTTSAPPSSPSSVGFHFVDVKHCHGYLGHELLSALHAPGPVRRQLREPHALRPRDHRRHPAPNVPGLMIGVRLSAFDHPPFKPDPTRGGDGKLGPGIPEEFDST